LTHSKMLSNVLHADHSENQLSRGVWSTSLVLKMAVCVTFPAHCFYWTKWGTNPHSVPHCTVPFQNK
jgi:hypothetical protein